MQKYVYLPSSNTLTPGARTQHAKYTFHLVARLGYCNSTITCSILGTTEEQDISWHALISMFFFCNLIYIPIAGPAPVATYFRPNPSASASTPQPPAEGGDNAALTTPAAAAAAKTGFGGQSPTNDETSKSEKLAEHGGAEAAKGGEGTAEAEGAEGGGVGEQKWELLDEDDGVELTARFRGRKFM